MRNVIRQKLADSLAADWPKLTRREARVPAIPGKAHAVVGMRRAGKSCFLKQCFPRRGGGEGCAAHDAFLVGG